MPRPYFQYRLEQLRALAAKHPGDEKVLAAVRHELTFRKTKAARTFLSELSRRSAKPRQSDTPSRSASHSSQSTTTRAYSKQLPFSLTEEQLSAVTSFLTKGSLRVFAFAGAGKTSTLVAMAKTKSRPGLYLAFNRAIANEAKQKFPEHVDCRTTHSLAYRTVIGQYRDASKLTQSWNARAIAEMLSLKPVQFSHVDVQNSREDALVVTSSWQGALVKLALQRFCQSADRQFLPHHIVLGRKLAVLKPEHREQLTDLVAANTKALWSRMLDPRDPAPLGHDGYLKLWALSDPAIPKDYILLDEAQDTNSVVLGVLQRQESQIVYVGDPHQQIYEWRGAINAMETIATSARTNLTMSFRFGDTIANAANKILKALGEKRTLIGNPNIQSQLGTFDCDAVLCRTNGALITELLRLIDSRKKVHVTGGVDEILRLLYGVCDLQKGKPTDVPEFFGFSSWDDVLIAAKADELPELMTFINLVEQHSAQKLIAVVKSSTTNAQAADIEASTVHKAKGREWDRVRLTDDFLIGDEKDKDGYPPEEMRIAYVAITRAKQAIYVPPGLRDAFSIHQDARFDSAPHRHRTTPPSTKTGPARRPQEPTPAPPPSSPQPQPPKKNWLENIRDWFR